MSVVEGVGCVMATPGPVDDEVVAISSDWGSVLIGRTGSSSDMVVVVVEAPALWVLSSCFLSSSTLEVAVDAVGVVDGSNDDDDDDAGVSVDVVVVAVVEAGAVVVFELTEGELSLPSLFTGNE